MYNQPTQPNQNQNQNTHCLFLFHSPCPQEALEADQVDAAAFASLPLPIQAQKIAKTRVKLLSMNKICGISSCTENKGYMIPCRGINNIINAPDEPNHECGRPAAMCKNCKQVCCVKCLPEAKKMAGQDDKFKCCACNSVSDLDRLPSSWTVPISYTHTLPEDEQVSANGQRALDHAMAELIRHYPPPPPAPPPPPPPPPPPA
jgi:hypothetical protein